MSSLYYTAAYKNKIISLLLKNKDFIKLINPTPSECDDINIIDVLFGGEWIIAGKEYKELGHIFDHNFVDETTTEQKTFVFVETNIDTIENHMFADFDLYICIFTYKGLVRITDKTVPTVNDIKDMGYFASTYANRIDVLCDIVDKVLINANDIPAIGKIKRAPRGFMTTYSPQTKYYGKCLKYKVSNYIEEDSDCDF